MKIGFQGWFLSQPFTGIGQHSLGLIKELAKKAEVTAVSPRPIKIPGVKVIVIKPKFGPLAKWYWERVQAPLAFAKLNLNLEYYPYPSPLPKKSSHKRAVTVHDLISWKDSRYAGNKIKKLYHRAAHHSLLYVDKIFTVSAAVHAELGIPNAKILPNAIPPLTSKISTKHDPNLLVYLGGYDIRKNVPELLASFTKIQKQFPQMKLQLIGRAHHVSKYYPALKLPPNATLLGNIPDKKVYELLASAFAFLHFSDSEGFNIPLLQAMSLGCPAIVKDIPVNREVSQNSALFISPKVSTLAIIKKLQDSNFRKQVSMAEKMVSKKYSWKKTAEILLKELK